MDLIDCQQKKSVVEKIRGMIVHSRTKEQLSTTRKFTELFIRTTGATQDTKELKCILLEKEKNLNY